MKCTDTHIDCADTHIDHCHRELRMRPDISSTFGTKKYLTGPSHSPVRMKQNIQGRQCSYHVTIKRVSVTILAVEKQ
jgi:hypothetical protein